jgi:DNA-binding CsgD family transcriptional regulator
MLLQVMSDLENEISPQKIKTIKAIQNGGSTYWKSVLEKFEKINPDFNQALIKGQPQLTKGERDFCSFVKLNLSNKEIAHLLQISPESVITKKYRILKKLNLPKEVDFQLWLSEMG